MFDRLFSDAGTPTSVLGRLAVWALVVGVLVVPASEADAAAEESPSSERVQGRWIVDLAEGVDPEDVARDHGGRVADVFGSVIGGFLFSGPDDRADELRRDSRVENVNPDLLVRASERLPTGVRRILARHGRRPDAHELGVTGRGQRVAILDTGIDVDHPDLRVYARIGKDCIGGGLAHDVEGHGTHVAGTVAARVNGHGVIGVAPHATVVPVRVLDARGVGSTSSIICGVNHLTRMANDGDPKNDVLIANMSFNGNGGPGHCDDGGLREAICRSVDAGVVYTASAGNSDGPVGREFPGNMHPHVIAVSAFTDYDGWPNGAAGCKQLFGRTECDDTLWTRSNYGWQVDVTAPGVLIASTAIGGGVEVRTGTSQAAPHAAGVAALIRQLRPNFSPKQVRETLQRGGECPDGNRNGRAGHCKGQGHWRSDHEGFTEPLVNARWTVRPLL